MGATLFVTLPLGCSCALACGPRLCSSEVRWLWGLEFGEQLPITAWLGGRALRKGTRAGRLSSDKLFQEKKSRHIQGSTQETLEISLEWESEMYG